jgi:hypothetical protein
LQTDGVRTVENDLQVRDALAAHAGLVHTWPDSTRGVRYPYSDYYDYYNHRWSD